MPARFIIVTLFDDVGMITTKSVVCSSGKYGEIFRILKGSARCAFCLLSCPYHLNTLSA